MREPSWDDLTQYVPPLTKKPPLGTSPYWVDVPVRLANLCEAIKNGNDYDKMEEWAWEALWQIRMAKFLKERKTDCSKCGFAESEYECCVKTQPCGKPPCWVKGAI